MLATFTAAEHSTPIIHKQVWAHDAFARWLPTLWPTLPQRHAVMLGPRSDQKYATVHQPLNSDDLALHYQGAITLAAPLIDEGDQGRISALDIDDGGEQAVERAIRFANQIGYHAWGHWGPGSGGHNGGHVWIVFDRPAPRAQLRALAQQIAAGADLEAETYPTKKTLRLPFGKHQRSERRGSLLLPTGEVFNLDSDQERGAGLVAVINLLVTAPNDSRTLPPPPPPPERGNGNWRSIGTDGLGGIAAFNRRTNLVSLLESYGAQLVNRLPHGGYSLRCPCGRHRNGDHMPSLEVRPSTHPDRYGPWIAIGWSPHCLLYVEPGHIMDPFGVHCTLENCDPAEEARAMIRRSRIWQ